VILRVTLSVPDPSAYVVAVQKVPADWLACTVPNLRAFARAYPGWSAYQTGGLSCGWRGAQMIREAEVTAW
jgi:hypothetical protein